MKIATFIDKTIIYGEGESLKKMADPIPERTISDTIIDNETNDQI